MAKNDLQGALDLLILKTLSQLSSMHGYGIVNHIRRVSDELLIVEEGSLYPVLRHLLGCLPPSEQPARLYLPAVSFTSILRNPPSSCCLSGCRRRCSTERRFEVRE